MDFTRVNNELFAFIEKCPTACHAVRELEKMWQEAGYIPCEETKQWELKEGGKYYVKRNDSSIIAFSLPGKGMDAMKGFHGICTHSDSPCFKIKENAEMTLENYTRLNTEKYGGMILSSWFDRPLSIAGRVMLEKEGGIQCRLVSIPRNLLVIPNLAIHMNRDMNKGVEYNPQVDMLPLFGTRDGKGLKTLLAEELNRETREGEEAGNVKEEDILSYDLFVYVQEKGCQIGSEEEYILAPRLDDLQCVFAAGQAMVKAQAQEYANLCIVFDNEEVGSSTMQGADSTFLSDVVERIESGFGKSSGWLKQMLAGSFFISADNAHALHPNHPEKADPTNRPILNGGPVIKYHGSQKYTTDAKTAAVMKLLCKKAGVPVQSYTNRSDILGGSTLGNISTSHLSVPTVDVGLAQLAMHSAVETAGAKDTAYAIAVFEEFYKGE